MKKLSLILAFLLALTIGKTTRAQENEKNNETYSDISKGFAIQAGATLGMFDVAAVMMHKDINHFGAFGIFGYQFNKNLFLGIGAEFFGSNGDYSDKIYDDDDYLLGVPVFADFKFNFTKAKISPFLEVRIGYTIKANEITGYCYYNHPWDAYYDYDNAIFSMEGLYTSCALGLKVRHSSISLGFNTNEVKGIATKMTDYTTGEEIKNKEIYNKAITNFFVKYSYTIQFREDR